MLEGSSSGQRGRELEAVRGSQRMHAKQPLRQYFDPPAGLDLVPHLRQRMTDNGGSIL